MKNPQKILNMFLIGLTIVQMKHPTKGLNEAKYIISAFLQKFTGLLSIYVLYWIL